MFDLFPQIDSKSYESETCTESMFNHHTCKTSVGSLKIFEGEELLKGRHILLENYKAIPDPNSQETSLRRNGRILFFCTTETSRTLEINIK